MLHNAAPCCCIAFCINAAGPSSSAAAAVDGEASDVVVGEPGKPKRMGRGPGRRQVAARAAAMKSGPVEEDICVDE